MAVTTQQSAINFATTMMTMAAQIQAVRSQLAAMIIQYTDLAPVTIWQNCDTFAWNTDGSPGAADGTLVNSHPISVGSLNRSESQLAAMVQFLADFNTFMTGGALSATSSRNIIIDQIVG